MQLTCWLRTSVFEAKDQIIGSKIGVEEISGALAAYHHQGTHANGLRLPFYQRPVASRADKWSPWWHDLLLSSRITSRISLEFPGILSSCFLTANGPDLTGVWRIFYFAPSIISVSAAWVMFWKKENNWEVWIDILQ